jgi:outer membrane protein TolC
MMSVKIPLAGALLSVLVAGMPVSAQAVPPGVPVVTLEEARRRALVIDPAAVGARSQVATAGWERRTARIDLLTPTVTAGTSYTHFSEPFFNFGTGNISPNATSATLQANYTLLGAGKLGELRRSGASLAYAEASEIAASFAVTMDTDGAYFAVLANRELARVNTERLRRAQEQLTVARVRVVAGDAISTDSLQLLLEVNRARFALLRSDSAVAVSRLHLGRRIGLEAGADAAPIDTTAPPQLPLSVDAAILELRSRGPSVQAARAAERRADALLGVEREGYFPDISLGATTGAYDSEFFPSALSRSQLALTVSIPIWNGGQRELQVARARAQRTVARAERADHERAASELMAGAWHGYETSRAGIELALVGVVVANETFRVQGARYREGATTILDLLAAQVALSEAEAALVQARYSARLALARIESLLGRRIFENASMNPLNR